MRQASQHTQQRMAQIKSVRTKTDIGTTATDIMRVNPSMSFETAINIAIDRHTATSPNPKTATSQTKQ